MNDTDSPQAVSEGNKRAVFSPVKPPVAVAAPPPPPSPQPAVQAPVESPVVAPPAQVLQVKNNHHRLIFFILLGLLVTSVSALSFQLYWDSQQKLKKLQEASPQAFVQLEGEALVAKVKRHMILPEETPLINTISDVETLKKEVFYANAQNGDKVLVYSKRAILYSPSRDRVIEVGFIRQPTPTPPVAESESGGSPQVAGASTSAKVLFNGENR